MAYLRNRRVSLWVGCALLGLLIPTTVVDATVLENRQNEWSFSLNAEDVDDQGTTIDYTFSWSWIFNRGYHEFGVAVSGFDYDFDDPFLTDVDGHLIGPIYQWNWFPENEQATGFLAASIGKFLGDEGDIFDVQTNAVIGIKIFIGNSAAVQTGISFIKLRGKDNFEDVDARRLFVGISIFTHER